MPMPPNINDREQQKFALTDDDKVAVRTLSTGQFIFTGLAEGGLITEVELTDSEWRALPATSLAKRKSMGVQNTTAVDMLINYVNDSLVTIGVTVAAGNERYYDLAADVTIYGRMVSGTHKVIVEEIA